MTSKINQTQSTQTYTTTPQRYNTGSGNNSVNNVPVGGSAAYKEGYGDKISKTQNQNLTAEEEKKLNAIYKKIEKICLEQDIDPNFAKSEKLLERIAGVQTSKELVMLKAEEIDFIVKILESHLGFGDGLGYGKKDKKDFDKLVKDLHKKFGYEKTGGSRFGQWWHNVKKGVKNVFGAETIDKCKTPEEISTYFKEKYLNDIENLSIEEKKEKYAELLREFFYTFNSIKDKNKQIMMIKSIENIAANDRDLIIELIAKCLSTEPEVLKEFGKALNENLETIVTSKDALGETLTQSEAAKMAHTAFKHMSEEDVKEALEVLNRDAKNFYEIYGEQIKELRERKANGEQLTEAEEALLIKAENVYEGKYAGATTGTIVNTNIEQENKVEILTTISNQTQELGIQEEVLETISEFVKENPEEINLPQEEFKEIMDRVTDGEYTETVNKQTQQENNVNKTNEETVTNNQTENKAPERTIVETTQQETNHDNDLGFEKREPVDSSRVENLYRQIQNNIEPLVTKEKEAQPEKNNNKNSFRSVVQAARGTTKDFTEYVKENGTFNSIVEIYNNIGDITNKGVLTYAKKLYTMLNADRQEEILRSIKSTSGFNELLAQTSDQVVMKLDTNFNSHYTNKQVEEAQKKAQKRIQHGLA